MTQHTSTSLEETRKLAAEFVKTLHGGDVVELVGDLGSGKTTFVRGILEALGSVVRVKSPTFTIMNEYPVFARGLKQVVHLDLYRFKDPREIEALNLDDYIATDKIVFVEWPNVFDVPIFKSAKRVEFVFVDENTRKISW